MVVTTRTPPTRCTPELAGATPPEDNVKPIAVAVMIGPRFMREAVAAELSRVPGIRGVTAPFDECDLWPDAALIPASSGSLLSAALRDLDSRLVLAIVQVDARAEFPVRHVLAKRLRQNRPVGVISPLCGLEEVVQTARDLSRGGCSVSPDLRSQLSSTWADYRLPKRQMDVLRSLAAGRTNQQICTELGIEFETVKTHVRRILRTLEAESRAEAVAHAVEIELLSSSDVRPTRDGVIDPRFAKRPQVVRT